MTDAQHTESEDAPEEKTSDNLIAIAVDATDLRPAALRGIAEMLEEGPERRARFAEIYREQADDHERRAAQEQAVLNALFALPAGGWVSRKQLAQDLAVQEWEVECAIGSLVARRWPVHGWCLADSTYEYRLATPNAQARLVGGTNREPE